MDINKKILFGILLICITFMTYIVVFKMKPDFGFRAQDFEVKNIQKVVVTKHPYKVVYSFTDSLKIAEIRNQLIKSKEANIKNTRIGQFKYDLKFHYMNGDSAIMYSKNSPTEGVWIKYLATFYKNDSLFITLDKLTD